MEIVEKGKEENLKASVYVNREMVESPLGIHTISATKPSDLNYSMEYFAAKGSHEPIVALIILTNNRIIINSNGILVSDLINFGFEGVASYSNLTVKLEDYQGKDSISLIEKDRYYLHSSMLLKHRSKNIYYQVSSVEVHQVIIDEEEEKELQKRNSNIKYIRYLPLLDGFFACDTIEEQCWLKEQLLATKTVIDKVSPTQGKLNLVIATSNGFDIRSFNLSPNELNFDYYNDNFKPVHELIVEALSKEKSKGILILHGIKGSGKTSYIRHLTTLGDVINKKFIFIPLALAIRLGEPGFIELLMNNPNSILIVEDGEKIVKKRDSNSDNSAVSTLLNLSDGLLSDCLNIQIIITLNTKLTNIDDALTRKGRLILEYEFTELEATKVDKLLGTENGCCDMTLADVLNYESKLGKQIKEKSKSIGFGK